MKVALGKLDVQLLFSKPHGTGTRGRLLKLVGDWFKQIKESTSLNCED